MKAIIISIILVLPFIVMAQHEHHQKTTPEKTKIDNVPVKTKPINKSIKSSTDSKDLYSCPMHPEVQNKKPGKCPKCGMQLIKQNKKADKPPIAKPIFPPKEEPKEESKETKIINPEVIKEPTEKAGHKIEQPGLTYKPKLVRYDLYIEDTIVNYTGKKKRAISINGSIPAPTLIFTEGDTAEIHVHNELDEETSIHWHGVFLPNRFDGVPNLTQMPIKPHQTFIYKYPVIQNGTYWYHSHTELQEQIGMYGALIFNKVNESSIPAIPVVLSEWTDMNPKEVNRALHNGTDWFAIKKGTTQSYSEAIAKRAFGIKLKNEWKRMTAMDVSDVAYDKFLVNGKENFNQPQFKKGDKVKLRIVNGGASSYFWLTYAGGKITVVGNDGNDVEPVGVDRLIIAVAETYDVIVTIPDNLSYEFLFTPEDRTKSASLWLGNGKKLPVMPLPKLKYFEGMKMMNDMMKMNGDMEMMGMEMSNQTMDMNIVMYPEVTGYEDSKDKMDHKDQEENKNIPDEMLMKDKGSEHEHEMSEDNSRIITLNYAMLKAPEKTTLRKGPEKLLRFELTGNMSRYVWTLDNKTVSESDKILIKKGENVKIILFNNSMMRHPMHLHGHDFRVLNGQGEYAPLKNVLDIIPMETDTIEFAATESGDWFFHCHILYHMMSGMGRIFSYENSPPNPEIPNPKLAQRRLFWDDQHPHFMAKIGIESNGSDGEAMLAQTRWKLSTMWHLGYHDHHGYEVETMLGRFFGKMQWFYPYVGFDYHYQNAVVEKNLFGQESNKTNRKTYVAGFEYTLPMLLIADFRVDGDGKFRFQLTREDMPITKRLRFSFMGNTDKEFMLGFRYILTKYFSLSTHYDSDMGPGVGLTLTY